jgi:hypothetical protein
MARRFFTVATTAALGVSLTASSFASAPPAITQKDQVVSQLGQQVQRFDLEAQTTKGIPRTERERQSLRVKKLIQRLQAGEAVDSQEIDKLLKEQPWPR